MRPAARLASTLALLLLPAPALAEEADAERGRYLAAIMDCGGCHTRGVLLGQPDPELYLAGSEVGFELPGLGIFWPPNLTSDHETGLGGWSADGIITAIRPGARPDGRVLAPIMPYHAYAALSDEDAQALAAILQRLPPASFEAPGPIGPGKPAPGPYLTVVMPD